MHKDFHLYGTYLAALKAGMDTNTARKIACAAQAVDEFTYGDYATCQKPLKMIKTDIEILKTYWSDFHFLPGEINNQGLELKRRFITKPEGVLFDLISTTAEKCVTAINSQNFTGGVTQDDCCAIIGVSMHIIADTYSHQGFSGIPSDLNLVENLKMCNREGLHFNLFNINDLFVPSWIFTTSLFSEGGWLEKKGEALSIGHGTAGTAPDISWIDFKYDCSDKKQVQRDNIKIFSDAFVKMYELLGGNSNNSASIKKDIEDFLLVYRDFLLKQNNSDVFLECNDVTFESILKFNILNISTVNKKNGNQKNFSPLNECTKLDNQYESYKKDINDLATAYNKYVNSDKEDDIRVKQSLFKDLEKNSLFYATYHIRELIAKKLDPDLACI